MPILAPHRHGADKPDVEWQYVTVKGGWYKLLLRTFGTMYRCSLDLVRILVLRIVTVLAAGVIFCMPGSSTGRAADPPIQLRVVGGLADVSQYTKFEEPFWTHDVPLLTGGRVQADIHPFDRSGMAGQEMLQLMRLGVVPFGTALLSLVSGDEPTLNAVDLPTLNPDIATLRRMVALYRDHLRKTLKEKYGIELLGVYAYPAQALFCAQPFTSLKDIAGRKIRTSSVGQSEMMTALGAIPVQIPFAGMVDAIGHNVVECAITGTMSGAEIGLPEVTSYISPMAISWGLSFFGANKVVWDQLPPDIRDQLRGGISTLEAAIWNAADHETAAGIACDIGSVACVAGKNFHMNLVPLTTEDEAERKQLLTQSILPRWIERCGIDCVTAWNGTFAKTLGIEAKSE